VDRAQKISAFQVIEVLFPGTKLVTELPLSTLPKIEDGEAGRLYIKGSALTHIQADIKTIYERCCFPVPNERIVGIVDKDAIHVHAMDCLKA